MLKTDRGLQEEGQGKSRLGPQPPMLFLCRRAVFTGLLFGRRGALERGMRQNCTAAGQQESTGQREREQASNRREPYTCLEETE